MTAMTDLGKLRLPFLEQRPAWWRLVDVDRRWLQASAATIATMLALGALAHHWQSTQTADAAAQLAAAQHDQTEAAQRESQQAAARAGQPQPWWTKLSSSAATAEPTTPRSAPEQLSADTLALALKLNVQVLRLQFTPPAQVTGAPYRSTTVQAEVKGPYGDIKRWLSELLARRPHTLAVKSTDLRRGTGTDAATAAATGTDPIEATIELRLFEQASAR